MMRLSSERWSKVCFWIVLVVMLIVGRYTYQDYGLTVDENVERQSAFINYQYAAKTLFGIEIDVFDDELSEWKDRYYGVALQMPMVAVEHLTDFTMPVRDAFLLRHLYTFLLSIGGWVCFYGFCKKIFRNGWLALLGMLMGVLYPRFWGEQFTNIKDMVFMATCSASLFCIAACLEKEKWRWDFLSAIVFAFCSNTRFIGLMFPALLFGYRILRDVFLQGIKKGEWGVWLRSSLLRYAANIVLMFVVYFAISPASWSDPFGYLMGVIRTFSNYTGYGGRALLFGKFYPANQLPWYYLTVWILISLPIWYLALIGLGIVHGGKFAVKKSASGCITELLLGEYRYFVLCFVVAVIPLVTPIFKEVTLYTAWRHAYYIFPSLIVMALFGARWVWGKIHSKQRLRQMAILMMCAAFAFQLGRTIWIHPFEKVYFNGIGRPFADGLDRDYWSEADYQQVQTLLRNDDTHRIHLAGDVFVGRTIFYFLPEEQMERFYVEYDYPKEAEYIIDTADTPELQLFEGYTPVHQLRMKNGILLSTIHIRDDILQERFGGVYPEYNLN